LTKKLKAIKKTSYLNWGNLGDLIFNMNSDFSSDNLNSPAALSNNNAPGLRNLAGKGSTSVGNDLLVLYQEFISTTDANGEFQSNNQLLQLDPTNTSVLVRINASDVLGLLPELEALGFQTSGIAPQLNLLEGFLPITAIPQMDSFTSKGLFGVVSIAPPITGPNPELNINLPEPAPAPVDPNDLRRVGLDRLGLPPQTVNSRLSSDLLVLSGPVTDGVGSLGVITDSLTLDETFSNVAVRVTSDDINSLLPELQQLGFEVLGSAPELNFVEGFVPIANINNLGQLLERQGFGGAIPVYKPVTDIGSADSQADFVFESNRVRAALPTGFDGTGVTIGVLSDSYNSLGGAAAGVASGDLPGVGNPNGFTTPVNVLQDSGTSDEGRAMIELIHDIAPGAAIAFATANGGELNYAQNIRDLADPAMGNADVVVDDVVYLTEPFFQDGVVAQAVDDVVLNDGAAYFGSAGNRSRRAYESIGFRGAADSGGFFAGTFHDFDPGAGTDTRQQITLANNQIIRFALQWDDPFLPAGNVDTDLDIALLTGGTNTVVTASAADNIATQIPFELLQFQNTTGATATFDVIIQAFAGPQPGRIKYVDFGGSEVTAEFPLNAPTVNPHVAAVNGKAVAAIPYFDQTTPESFTSEGPSTILFDTAGNPIAPQVRQTPDIAGIDGVDNTFFGSDFDSTGNPNFFGTSAAAPNVAAVAALVLDANPAFTPVQIYGALESTAIDIGPAGFDNVTGFGLVNAYDAIFNPIVPAALDFTEDFEDGDLPISFETNSTGNGRIQVDTANGPIGTRHITLDGSFPAVGINGLNELILNFDATGASNIMLSFDQREFGDEDNPMPATFTGSNNSDGVALSVDGTNWFRLISLTGGNSINAYQNNMFDLSAFATMNGLTLGSDVRIKFQQFDNFPIPNTFGSTDGMAFDNISVFAAPTYEFSAATFDTPEGDVTNTPNVVEITRSGSTSMAETLTVSVTGGTATPGNDFTAGPFMVNFGVGVTSAFVPIEILGDTNPEPDDTIDLQITGFSGSGVAGMQDTTTFTLTDDDMLMPTNGPDTLIGGAGPDNIDGLSGRDSIDGAAGADTLTGGIGSDTLTGGTDADTFVYTSLDEAVDIITDFTVGTDLIDVATLLTNETSFAGVDAIADGFVSFVTFGNFTIIRIDVDGPGGSLAPRTLAGLNNNPVLSASDFVFV
jgi:hypothetical protein